MEDRNNFIIELSQYTSPTITEVKNKNFVEYGADNNYFKYLIDRYVGSTTNNAIINGIVKQIYGKGLDATDSTKKPMQYAALKSILSKKDLKRVVADRKIMGMAALQVSYKGNKVAKITHIPMQTLRPTLADDKGVVQSWLYHPNWAEAKPSDKKTEIPVFGTSTKGNEVYIVRDYVAGYDYFSPVDYVGSLPYAVLEEEIADYLINDALNHFSGTKVVNFNDGIPNDKSKRESIKNGIVSNLTGSRGQKVIVSFNNSAESKTTVDDIPLTDAAAHYQYLSEECQNKLKIGHRVISGKLIGIETGNGGLGNNADEIKTAQLMFSNITIKSFQEELTDAIEDILAVNGISLNLYFKTLDPLEFTNVDVVLDNEDKEEETGIKMYKESIEDDLTDELISKCDDDLEGWELVSENDVDYELEDEYDEIVSQIEADENAFLKSLDNDVKLSMLDRVINFVSTGRAVPNAKSSQDKEVRGVNYKVRYRYVGNPTPERSFCKKMMNANKLYRKEDIIAMGNKAVNKGLGKGGADTYSIWLYKGGAQCKHKWRRVTFRSETGIDVKSPLAPKISTGKARKQGFNPVNEKEVSMTPNDMPNKGYVNKR
jgi:hypothetical protein